MNGRSVSPIVVFDTCIMVAGLRSKSGASNRLLRGIGQGAFSLGLTATLVLEYESVLKRPGLVPFSPTEIDAFIAQWCLDAVCRRVPFSLRPTASDPNDDHVLEAAVATGGEFIVTLNQRDLAAGAGRYGIRLLTPGEALVQLGIQP